MILVTGATGLTGRFVVDELVRRGYHVRALVRRETPPIDGVELVAGDLGEVASLARAARGATGIVHTACTYGDAAVDAAVDVAAMRALVSAWSAGPFVYLSSLDVYGLVGSGVITEDTPPAEVHNDYSRGKQACEQVLADEARQRGRLDHVALRAPYIWGPHPTAYRRLVTPCLQRGEPIVLPSVEAGHGIDTWIDVRDLATIIAESLARPAGEPLNVATGSFAWRDLYACLIRWTGSASTIVHRPLESISEHELPRKQLYVQSWRFSEARLEARLGAIPRRSFEITVRDTVASGGGLQRAAAQE